MQNTTFYIVPVTYDKFIHEKFWQVLVDKKRNEEMYYTIGSMLSEQEAHTIFLNNEIGN